MSSSCSTYLCIYCLILVCALTRDQTPNLAILGWPSQGPELFLLNRIYQTLEISSCESLWVVNFPICVCLKMFLSYPHS